MRGRLRACCLGILLLLTLPGVGPATASAAGRFVELVPQRPAPALSFLDVDGRVRHLETFRGRLLLVNFWATWCAPCRAEMPALDRLQRDLGDSGLTVLALALDEEGASAVVPFFRAAGLDALDIYLDPARASVAARGGGGETGLPLYGLPITYAIAPDGRLLGYLLGAADWDAPSVRRLIARLAGQAPPPVGRR